MTTNPSTIASSPQNILAQEPLSIEYLEPYLRENTGRMMTDSGDYYGRQYNRPMPSVPTWFNAWKPSDFGHDRLAECYPAMSLGHFLIENCAALPGLQKLFDQYAESDDEPWADNIDSFFKNFSVIDPETDDCVRYCFVGGKYPEDGYYTYNYENDFDQDFQFWVLVPEDESKDYQYSERGILIVRSHNGCDARYGFSRPLFLTLTGEPDYFRFPELKCEVFVQNIDEFPEIGEATRDDIEERIEAGEAVPKILDEFGFDFDHLSDDKQDAFFRQRSSGKLLRLGAAIPQTY